MEPVGYADSSPVIPTKRGVIQDGKTVVRYVREHCGSVPIIVWGHSLGSSVSTHIVSDLSLEDNPPHALILESPFNNIKDEVWLLCSWINQSIGYIIRTSFRSERIQ